MKKCFIIAGGYCQNEIKAEEDTFVIAADSGYYHCLKQNIVPDILIGDFDSYKGELPKDASIIRLPCKKDDTDLMYAVKYATDKGFCDFTVYGGYGSRQDQSFAMLQSLLYITNKGADFTARAVCDGFTVTALTNGKTSFKSQNKATFSVFAASGNAYGVNISGAEYILSDFTLLGTDPIGVSNIAKANTPVTVSVKNGSLLIFLYDNLI